MVQVYKVALGAATSVLLIFGTFYMNTVEKTTERAAQNVVEQQRQMLVHEQRITTLEESKRNQETLLKEIRDKLEEVSRAIGQRNR